MANHFASYDPNDPLMRCYQVALRRHATTTPQQTTPSQPSSTSVIAPATSMSQDGIHGRFLTAATNCDTRAMQQEFHRLLSVAESRNQDCLFLKRLHEQEVEANHGEMEWMRNRIQHLEEEMRRVTSCKKGIGQVYYSLTQNGDTQSR
ncbi:uncharacterized protein J4E78_003804 [Alternaria triticimaculans]|uniref:uncharacterized protein n=1 Tax=Alternaria triticimaculans TaxID=297637 RepID=UPI0020C30D45|nr:uncharacterized protein J4E78_003804 [Alternaria triticimaculans]KAI4663392.1 hypothetical protein J4E78_003804 [Alternaria triticimaculans]